MYATSQLPYLKCQDCTSRIWDTQSIWFRKTKAFWNSSWADLIFIFFACLHCRVARFFHFRFLKRPKTMGAWFPSWPSGWFKSDHKKSSASDCRAWISMFFVDLLHGLGHLQWSQPKLRESWQKANILWHVLCFLHMFFSSILYGLYRLLCKCMRSMLWTQWKQKCSTSECE